MNAARTLTLTSTPTSPPRKRRRRTRVTLVGFCVLLIVVVVTQIVLPPIASKLVRESLEPQDRGVSVSVSSVPAIKLLLGQADSASIHIAEASPGGTHGLEELLARATNVGRLTATVETMYLGPLELRHVSLSKRGPNVSAEAEVTRSSIEHILPTALGLNAADAPGGGLRLSIATTVLGQRVSLSGRLVAQNGALEIAPELPILGLVNVSVFNDLLVPVTSVSVRSRADGTYIFAVNGHYT